MFPLLVCQHPPVRDVRTANEIDLMTTYEVGVLAGVVCVAFRTYDLQRREQALAFGGKAANRERQHGHYHLERWKRKLEPLKRYRETQYDRPQPLNKGTSVKRVAQMEYRRKKKSIRPDDVITVRCSRYDILRSAGSEYRCPQPQAGARGARSFEARVGPMPSPLFNWQEGEDGNCDSRSGVNGLNLRSSSCRYLCQLRSSVATCLHLWALSIAGTRTPRRYQMMPFKKLCDLLGIPTEAQAVRRALDFSEHEVSAQLADAQPQEIRQGACSIQAELAQRWTTSDWRPSRMRSKMGRCRACAHCFGGECRASDHSSVGECRACARSVSGI